MVVEPKIINSIDEIEAGMIIDCKTANYLIRIVKSDRCMAEYSTGEPNCVWHTWFPIDKFVGQMLVARV